MLKNPRRERFAQLLASGKTATDAYVEAGYRPNRFNAATMARGSRPVLSRHRCREASGRTRRPVRPTEGRCRSPPDRAEIDAENS